MENTPLVSIIVPCYNDWQYIEQAVSSALNQTYSNIEVIVVDDGSDLRTKKVVKKLEPKITRLLTQENKGQSTARNNGIREATGTYILVLDSDDFFEPSFVEKAIVVFLENKNTKIVTCFAKLLFKNHKSYIFRPLGGNITNFLYANDSLGTSLFRKYDWELCGGYDQNMIYGLEDWEFFIRLLKDGGEVKVVKEVLYNYRKRNHSTTDRIKKIKYDTLNYIVVKNKELYVNDFDTFVQKFCLKLKLQDEQLDKEKQRIEFKIGSAILKPLRWVKKWSTFFYFKN